MQFKVNVTVKVNLIGRTSTSTELSLMMKIQQIFVSTLP